MAQGKKRKPYIQAAIFGVLSIASYVVLFSNQGMVTEYFTRGGKYAALPIAAAFYFSFLHGAFASNVLSLLGLEAAKGRTKKT
jgi:hypothetical protein